MTHRYLTKSKFQLGMECPTKLYYCDKPEYSNLKSEDTFLQALAEGGYQIAALAKAYYKDGIEIKELDNEQALEETAKLLEQDSVILFEAAIRFDNLFARVDILLKEKDHLTIVEIKSKSISSKDKPPFFVFKGGKDITSTWKPYVYDAAFQKYVLTKAFPHYRISTYLLLVDKDSSSPTNGLNQKFRIIKDENGRAKIIVSNDLTQQDLSRKILKNINVSEEIDFIFYERKFRDSMSFSEYINFLSTNYVYDTRIPPVLGSVCRKCEFRLDPKSIDTSLKSGFMECWSEVCSLKENEPTVLDIWDFKVADDFIKQGTYRITQLSEVDFNIKKHDEPGLSSQQRRWLQAEKIIKNDKSEFIDIVGLRDEINSWTYPLHFIDFETAMPPIPFNKGERPFLGLAFQFSHHILYESGMVEHAGQYINDKIGQNPNLDFIRELKLNLENSAGTIFRYAAHENSYLNTIYTQLKNSQDAIPDKDELIDFIKQISQPTENNKGEWEPGTRNMVDLLELVKKFYYDPLTGGSNSIKKVFPAILNRSAFLQEKYSAPIYGGNSGIKSLSFPDPMQWVQKRNNKIVDPYELLPKLFSELDLSDEQIELLFHDDKLKEGGSASIAYARMQFTEMSDQERAELRSALLKYCELDTLAMVMIVESWKNMVFGK
ncbi:MAG TPA: DUF2779 domain-containing protein [Gammaproteobacteria bacterium]|nr:DUF2779 domain-containing protein [Gammaproteobacteria bacterium]